MHNNLDIIRKTLETETLLDTLIKKKFKCNKVLTNFRKNYDS